MVAHFGDRRAIHWKFARPIKSPGQSLVGAASQAASFFDVVLDAFARRARSKECAERDAEAKRAGVMLLPGDPTRAASGSLSSAPPRSLCERLGPIRHLPCLADTKSTTTKETKAQNDYKKFGVAIIGFDSEGRVWADCWCGRKRRSRRTRMETEPKPQPRHRGCAQSWRARRSSVVASDAARGPAREKRPGRRR